MVHCPGPSPNSGGAPQPAPCPIAISLHGHRVLILEDEFFIAAELQDIVGDAGAEVIGPAMSVTEAMLLIDNHAVTAAILDVRLGDHDSLGVARRLDAAGTPFIFHTGNRDCDELSKTWPRALIIRKLATTQSLLAALVAVTTQ